MREHGWRGRGVAVVALMVSVGAACSAVRGDVVSTAYPFVGGNDAAAVASAAFSGWYAVGDTFQDRVEVRDARGELKRAITRSEMAGLAPWMSLDGGPDGPSGLAFSASGRVLFILVHDDTVPGDGQPSDVLLRYEVSTDTLTRQARLNLFDRGDVWPRLGAAHHAGYVYVGKQGGQIAGFAAFSSAMLGTPTGTWTLPGATGTTIVHGIAIDRDAGVMYAATENGVHRAMIPGSPSTTPMFTQVCAGSDIRALAWGDHYGGAGQRGLYILSGNGAGGSRIEFVPAALAGSASGVTPALYTSAATTWHDITMTAEGTMLVGGAPGPVMLSDTNDTRLGLDAWMHDELSQATLFGRGLISPDGEPSGWVIDGDVLPGQSRFHPATPDGAAWTVLLLMMNERINGDPLAKQDVARVLVRYAGLASDNIRPMRNTDGVYKHWIDPLTGNTKGTWPDEYATLSTMKIVAAAARAMDRYPDDPVIVRAASRIIFGCRNWASYFQNGTNAMAFKGQAGGGPDTNSWSAPYHEGIIYAEQTGVYGAAPAGQLFTANWFNRSMWPTASYVSGKPITVASGGVFQPAFLTLYPALLSAPYRAIGAWKTQVDNVRWSSAAFTDDTATRYYTAFSAGTSPNGYNADTFTNHPGNLTTFTSLLGLCASGDPAEAVGGYAAYRKGARQTFKTGASILYRRPYDSETFVPNSAGLPDVACGALGLSDLMVPGSIDALLARAYPKVEMCPQDVDGDGRVTIDDLYRQVLSPSDLSGNGVVDASDAACLENWLRRAELARMAGWQR